MLNSTTLLSELDQVESTLVEGGEIVCCRKLGDLTSSSIDTSNYHWTIWPNNMILISSKIVLELSRILNMYIGHSLSSKPIITRRRLMVYVKRKLNKEKLRQSSITHIALHYSKMARMYLLHLKFYMNITTTEDTRSNGKFRSEIHTLISGQLYFASLGWDCEWSILVLYPLFCNNTCYKIFMQHVKIYYNCQQVNKRRIQLYKKNE